MKTEEAKNIRLLLQYDGSRYDGWQRQKNTEKTIQGKLEQVLKRLYGTEIEVHGSGRTDAGVHALGQVANFHLPDGALLQKPEEIQAFLNRYLPEDIGILFAEAVPVRFHSRLNAVSKTYLYRIETAPKKDVFSRKYVYGFGRALDVEAMKTAAAMLEGTHDFRAFCSLKRLKKSTERTIFSITFEEKGSLLELSYTGDGFLYNMVRILTGTLLEIGVHERTPKSVQAALADGDRQRAGFTAPPEGLFLKEVQYRM